MNNIINLAIQVIPKAKDSHPYQIVDSAIEVIQKSGLKYRVCPMETVIEGPYDSVMELVKKVQLVCFNVGAHELLINIKIQTRYPKDVTIEEKMEKYD